MFLMSCFQLICFPWLMPTFFQRHLALGHRLLKIWPFIEFNWIPLMYMIFATFALSNYQLMPIALIWWCYITFLIQLDLAFMLHSDEHGQCYDIVASLKRDENNFSNFCHKVFQNCDTTNPILLLFFLLLVF